MIYWLLATPYSLHPHGLEFAALSAAKARGVLIQHGIPVFSPIVHSHSVARAADMDPYDHGIWLPSEAPFRHFAHGIIILRDLGWASSKGIAFERKEFEAAGKPVVWMDPYHVPQELLSDGS